MIKFTPEATALINHTLVVHFKKHPPTMRRKLHSERHFSIPVGPPHPRFTMFYLFPQSIRPLSALLRRDRHSLIPSVLIRAPLFHSALDTPISVLLSLRWALLNSHRRSYIGFRTLYPLSPFSALLR